VKSRPVAAGTNGRDKRQFAGRVMFEGISAKMSSNTTQPRKLPFVPVATGIVTIVVVSWSSMVPLFLVVDGAGSQRLNECFLN